MDPATYISPDDIPDSLNCSWYINDAWFREPVVVDWCRQQALRRAEASPTTVSAYLLALYVGAALLMVLLSYALLLCRARALAKARPPASAASGGGAG